MISKSDEAQQEKQRIRNSFLVEQQFSSSIKYYIHNSVTEIRRRLCHYCLAFFSVSMVVLASAISQSIIDKAPIIFLQTAQGTAGEVDITLQSSQSVMRKVAPPQFQYTLLNMTKINNVFNDYRRDLTAPRFQFPAEVKRICNEANINDGGEIFSKYQLCGRNFSSRVYFQDTNKELSIGCGRQYPFGEIPQNSIVLSQKLAILMDIKEGDDFFLQFNGRNLLNNLANQKCMDDRNSIKCKDLFSQVASNSLIIMKMQVFKLLDDGYGKLSGSDSAIAILAEFKNLLKIVGNNLDPVFKNSENSDFSEFIKSQNHLQYVDKIIINPPNRLDIYIDSNYDNIQFALTGLASRISDNLGVYPINLNMPVMSELQGLKFGALFLGIILNIIIVVLFVLSVLVLYNLLLVSIETQTYEMGVVRVLGINQMGVIWLIIVQSMFYVVPAVIFGLILSVPGIMYASSMIQKAVGIDIGIFPTPNAIALSLTLGILIPIISSITPITEALKQTLIDALDLTRNKTSAVQIEFQVEGQSFSWGRISFALITSLFGICIYYLLPLSLLSFNIGLLITIFFIILIGLLVGCCLLAMNVQYLLEKLVVIVCFWWENAAIKNLIVKNLSAHRIKNRRTAMMYAVSISFIIFIWTGMKIESISSDYGTRRRYGATLVMTSASFSAAVNNNNGGDNSANVNSTLPVMKIDTLLNDNIGKEYIQDYAYQTQDLAQFLVQRGFQSVYLTHLGQLYQLQPQVEAVTPNFFNVVFSEEFLKTVSISNTGLSLIQELYLPRGSQSAIIGETYATGMSISRNQDERLFLVAYNGTFTKRYELRASAILKNAVAFTFSDIPSVLMQSVVVSLPTYMQLGWPVIQNFDDIPMERLYIKLKDQKGAADAIYKKLATFITDNRYDFTLWDYRDFSKNIQKSQQLIDVIFIVLTTIVMILCFFSLISSMTANLLEQTKEIAVVRALGLTRNRMIRLYIYQAFTLVFSSSIIGMIVGIAVGFTMAMQRALFTGLPIGFVFPGSILLTMFIISIVGSFLSTYLPAKQIMSYQISEIIRLT